MYYICFVSYEDAALPATTEPASGFPEDTPVKKAWFMYPNRFVLPFVSIRFGFDAAVPTC